MKATTLALSCALLLPACGDDGGDGSADPDAAVDMTPDAGPQSTCTVIEASYPDLGMVTGTAQLRPTDPDTPDGPKVLSVQIPLNEDATPDVLFLELWGDTPPFDQGFAPTTQNLNMDNADLVICAACTFIAADFTDPNMIDFNMAYSGSLVIDTVDTTLGTGSITGSLTGVRFQEVTIDAAGQKPVVDGCRSMLEGVQFDFAMPAAP
jgi:hypothetical protein